MNDLTAYWSVRDAIRPGDVIAFGGSGFVSGAIKLLTHSQVSHVGVVLETKAQIDGQAQDGRIVSLIESTTLAGTKGVQVNRLSDRLAQYDAKGQAWWLPLSEPARRSLSLERMYDFLLRQSGDGYDYEGLFAFVLRQIPGVGLLFHRANDKREFCSELVAEAFAAGYLLHGVDPYHVSPQSLCEMNLYAACVQLIGRPVAIRNFNRR
jgi:hypothetical protein